MCQSWKNYKESVKCALFFKVRSSSLNKHEKKSKTLEQQETNT